MLAIRLMQLQGVQVDALNFETVFTCCQNLSARAADWLGVPITVLAQEDDYLDVIRSPQFGRGRGANPCVDCRIYMFRRAKAVMQQIGADFVVSGEVNGQRPMSQKRRDLDVIAHQADLEDLLLRPLSAKLLRPTKPEREGWVDRDQLFGFSGRSRKGLIRLARDLGFPRIPDPSTGCALTETRFSKKVFDLVKLQPYAGRWDFELLKYGRHFRYDDSAKVVVGRRETENALLESMHDQSQASSSAVLRPANYVGAMALVIGPVTQGLLNFSGGLLCRYGHADAVSDPQVEVVQQERTWRMSIRPQNAAEEASTLASIR